MPDLSNELEEFTVKTSTNDEPIEFDVSAQKSSQQQKQQQDDLSEEEKVLLKELSDAIDDATFNYPSVSKRVFAFMIDLVVTVLIAVPFMLLATILDSINIGNYRLEEVLSTIVVLGILVFPPLYIFGKDGLMRGRSIGRRAMGIILLKHDCISPANIFQSAIRQLPFFAASSVIPFLGGFFEFYHMNTKPLNLRLGDLMSWTVTIDYNEYMAFRSKFEEVDRRKIVPTYTLKRLTRQLFRNNVLLALR